MRPAGTPPTNTEWLQCIACKTHFPIDVVRYHCQCGALLAVERDLTPVVQSLTQEVYRQRALSSSATDVSGVWSFRELVLNLPASQIMTHPEGRTRLYDRQTLADWAGVQRLTFKHEGENPTGSFKDRGMTVAVSQANRLGLKIVGCASTGNTSAALASYAAQAGMTSVVFIPAGKIATGKLAQAVGYGARCLAIRGDFDAAMGLVQEAARELGIYLVNSINPFRIEGQKTIVFELLAQRNWKVPDWIIVPAGNLGNTSAFGKALREAKALGWIDRLPRIAAVQASGANPFYRSYIDGFKSLTRVKAETVATAIRIGDPVNFPKAKGVIEQTQGLVCEVSDQEIMNAKAMIDRSGIGCEPASAATLAGLRKLVANDNVKSTDDIVCILTGNILKDPEAVMATPHQPILEIDATLKAVEQALR